MVGLAASTVPAAGWTGWTVELLAELGHQSQVEGWRAEGQG